ncbi:MAG: phosphotransferase [Defluviitaleaceae bacterium]|nr:phosphotransferase [Defluviitaleaceae bacterium]
MNYNVLIEAFCEAFGLGEVKASRLFPTGLGNRTYSVETTMGKYVIKALNPLKIKSETDLKKIELTERIAEVVNEQGVTSISAKRIDGKFVNVFQEQYYIVFDFFEGKIMPLKSITAENCFEVGRLLAELHQINVEKLLDRDDKAVIQTHDYGHVKGNRIDWDYYFKRISKLSPHWKESFANERHHLYEAFDLSMIGYLTFIPQDVVIAHGDIFNHNILWKNNMPHIIDWEQSGFIDSTYDCLYTGIRWATNNHATHVEESVDMKKLYAFFEGYATKRKINADNIEINLRMVLYKRLLYFRNALRRYLETKDDISKERAEKQIIYTLSIFRGYKTLFDQLENIKNHLIECQPGQTYQRSPSYELMPKMKEIVEDHQFKMDELTKKYRNQKKELEQLKKEYQDIQKRAFCLRMMRKLKRMLKR